MARATGYRPYAPLLVLKPWAEGIWTVDGPEIGYGFAGLSIPCPTRMTVIRLATGALWVHSPVEFTEALGTALADLGPVAHLIAPNLHHYVHLQEWAGRYPQAQVHALPSLAEKPGLQDWTDLLADGGDWRGEIEHVHFAAGTFAESAFFHRASRTLILTDLMMNFEASRIASPIIRAVLTLGGGTGPNGRPSIDMRMALRKHRAVMREGLAAVRALAPERIILAHGLCYPRDALAEIRRAFAFLD